MNPDFPGKLVRHFKSDATDFLCKPIRVFLHNPIQICSVGIIDFYSQCIGNSVLLQINQSISQISLFFQLNGDFPRLSLADSPHLGQALRFFLDESKSIFSESLHDSGGQCRTYPFYSPGPEITLHSNAVLRHYHLKSAYFKLASIDRMIDVLSPGRNAFSLRQPPAHSHTDDFFPFRRKVQYRITILTVLIDNVFHVAAERFHPVLPIRPKLHIPEQGCLVSKQPCPGHINFLIFITIV